MEDILIIFSLIRYNIKVDIATESELLSLFYIYCERRLNQIPLEEKSKRRFLNELMKLKQLAIQRLIHTKECLCFEEQLKLIKEQKGTIKYKKMEESIKDLDRQITDLQEQCDKLKEIETVTTDVESFY